MIYLRGSRWHYRVRKCGKDYHGPCIGCETKAQAQAYEAQKKKELYAVVEEMKQTERDVKKIRNVKALVENYRLELSGGSLIALKDAYALVAKKPQRHVSRSSYASMRESYWNDFVAFMADKHPDAVNLTDVRRSHCEEYISYIEKNGRFNKKAEKLISPKTIREIALACKSVFSRLDEDAGIIHNPWNNVLLPDLDPIPREVFTMDELNLIWNGLQNEDFLRPLFVIAANSGLTEGDICTLRWDEIDFTARMIRRDRRKTGQKIVLPLIPELVSYLMSIPRKSEYVLPEHAELYLSSQQRVSSAVKSFLEGLGIKTCREIPGRKSVSVKDLHSMRHVFCYRAKKAGIPESTIQKMVGHAVLEMTKHYADHDTEEDLREQIQKLPPLLIEGETGANQGEVEVNPRERLAELLPSVPIETVRRWLDELSQGLPDIR